jgi:4-hydroxy 2-oxovalerate aldolase
MNKIEILDCTLRDGGYVNNWEFGKNNIKKIVDNLAHSNVDVIEMGFLSNKKEANKNKSIFDTVEGFSKFLPNNKKNSMFVAMINNGEYNSEDLPEFDGKSIQGLRVAFHKKDKEKAIPLCRGIAKKGYKLFIQPMVTINYTDKELLDLIDVFNEIKPYAFYVADSFGMMKQKDLLRMFYLIDNNLDKNINIGYHAHNNMQLAYSNAQALINTNTNRTMMIDSSIFGMGRGAGNLNTELIMQFLNEKDKNKKNKYLIKPLLKTIDEVLNKIYQETYWGYSLPHYLSAVHNCHPNYATHLSEKNTLTVDSIDEILSKITEEKRANFDKNFAEKLYLDYQNHTINDEQMVSKLAKDFSNKNIVLISPGKSLKNYEKQIEKLSKKENNLVVSINFSPENIKTQYMFLSNEKRLEQLNDNVKVNLDNIKKIYTSNIKENNTSIKINYMSLLNNTHAVRDNSALMFLNLLKKINFKQKVYLAGLDGYSQNISENYAKNDMVMVANKKILKNINEGISKELLKIKNTLNLEFVTPSLYENIIE